MRRIQRRDFLGLAAAAAGASTLGRLVPTTSGRELQAGGRPNILLIVFDATTALNMSLHGYARGTTPNFEAFAQRAVVFHSHYANGNFTSPGTASLLSGMLPWTHRAMASSAVMRQDLSDRNVFRLLQPAYHTAAVTQNDWANLLLHQMSGHIDQHLSMATLGLISDPVRDRYFGDDAVAAYRTYQGMLGQQPPNVPNALVLSYLLGAMSEARVGRLLEEADPSGLAEAGLFDVYTVRTSIEALVHQLRQLRTRSPFFAYYHFLFPHVPYRPDRQFDGLYKDDGMTWPRKRAHTLSREKAETGLVEGRRRYDEYLANVDSEFGRLIKVLEGEGFLDDAFVIVTSDHGEMFERGEIGHSSRLLFDPVVRIPLLLSAPGQRARRDVFAATSSIDILPTLLTIAGLDIPDWCEGHVLPWLGGVEDPSRGVFIVEAKESPMYKPLRRATLALVKGGYKLVHYTGYPGRYADHYELYNLNEDREELKNLAERNRPPAVFPSLKEELLAGWEAADRPFRRG